MYDLAHSRRRSVDVGGLALALSDGESGHGWGGWEEAEKGETRYAEVLIDVRAHTESVVNLEPLQLSPFIVIEDDVRERLIDSLGSWHFQPLKLPEEEVLACAYILFESLFRLEGMREDAGISLHVFQATYFFLYSAGAVPPVSILAHSDGRLWKPDKSKSKGSYISYLTNLDLLALYLTAVGHDVGHPGLTNAFLRNAKAPVAEVYDDKSVLEQMHYSLMVQIMRANGIAVLVDRPSSGPTFRKLLLNIVIATDMSVHDKFMRRYQELVEGKVEDELERRILVCQAIIKCADISNPSRPYIVSQDWAAALESEWSSQQTLEQHLQLPSSVKPASDEITEGIPEMKPFAKQSTENLQTWKDRHTALSGQSEPSRTDGNGRTKTQPEDFLSAFPPTLPRAFLSDHEHRTSSDFGSEFFSSSSGSRPPSVSSGGSHYETCTSSSPSPPASPLAELSPHHTLPRLEITTTSVKSHGRTPSIASASSYCLTPSDATAAIRAAYRASVRKKKSFHRSSWNPSPAEFTEVTGKPFASSPSPSPSSPAPALSLGSSSAATSITSASPLTPGSVSTESNSILTSLCDPLI
ncbi:hypothetical protein EIP86_009683 [Pleurotus ostreatoroseus]|nr:hypothetical protein EIP86_009683 [Pleurotus ostreatoroseus]